MVKTKARRDMEKMSDIIINGGLLDLQDRYSVILSDPPWWYNNRKAGGERSNKTKFGGGAMKHYPLMKDKDLLAMADAVKAITADNALMFMWATYPRLDFAIPLLNAWGFRYATVGYTWIKMTKKGDKPIYGSGGYTASNPEIVLIGVKGSLGRPVKKMTPSVIMTPRMGHSVKPDIHDRIRAMYPQGKALEMFARRPMAGWDSYGNQLTDERENHHGS